MPIPFHLELSRSKSRFIVLERMASVGIESLIVKIAIKLTRYFEMEVR